MNELAIEMQPTPSDWLFNPARKFFHTRPKSAMGCVPTVFTQLWYYTVKGIPTKLKNTRRLDYYILMKLGMTL